MIIKSKDGNHSTLFKVELCSQTVAILSKLPHLGPENKPSMDKT
jgi:hypothetical protein